MSSCDLVYGPPADLFRSMDSSENLNSSQEMHQRRDQSNLARHYWQTTRNIKDDLDRLNPRTFKCRTCTHTFTKKEDFWEHLRIHIKPEKMRTCPMCNFVTEHKQQLEYHVRNHMGSKPFKCEKCAYSCVTKSMLNTHMKSHSSVYQYNCADCDYATKYLYALKIHLRKLQHKPGKVLNPDGTINPEPVVDIYGTKRGPKPKKSKVDNPPIAQNRKKNKLRVIYPKMMSSGMIVPGQIVPGQISPRISPMSPILTISPMGNHVNVGAINTLGINGMNSLPYHVTYFINTMAGNLFIAGTPSIDSVFVNGNITAKEAIHENAINSGQTPSETPLNLKIPEGHCIQGNNKDVIRVPGMGTHRVPKYEVYHANEDVVPLDLSKSGQTSHGS